MKQDYAGCSTEFSAPAMLPSCLKSLEEPASIDSTSQSTHWQDSESSYQACEGLLVEAERWSSLAAVEHRPGGYIGLLTDGIETSSSWPLTTEAIMPQPTPAPLEGEPSSVCTMHCAPHFHVVGAHCMQLVRCSLDSSVFCRSSRLSRKQAQNALHRSAFCQVLVAWQRLLLVYTWVKLSNYSAQMCDTLVLLQSWHGVDKPLAKRKKIQKPGGKVGRPRKDPKLACIRIFKARLPHPLLSPEIYQRPCPGSPPMPGILFDCPNKANDRWSIGHDKQSNSSMSKWMGNAA